MGLAGIISRWIGMNEPMLKRILRLPPSPTVLGWITSTASTWKLAKLASMDESIVLRNRVSSSKERVFFLQGEGR